LAALGKGEPVGVGAEPLNSAPGAEEGSLHQYRDLTLLTLRPRG
jgi:hypothetical protein